MVYFFFIVISLKRDTRAQCTRNGSDGNHPANWSPAARQTETSARKKRNDVHLLSFLFTNMASTDLPKKCYFLGHH